MLCDVHIDGVVTEVNIMVLGKGLDCWNGLRMNAILNGEPL